MSPKIIIPLVKASPTKNHLLSPQAVEKEASRDRIRVDVDVRTSETTREHA